MPTWSPHGAVVALVTGVLVWRLGLLMIPSSMAVMGFGEEREFVHPLCTPVPGSFSRHPTPRRRIRLCVSCSRTCFQDGAPLGGSREVMNHDEGGVAAVSDRV